MKKIRSVFLAAGLCLVLAACGGKGEAPFDPQGEGVQTLLASAAFSEALTEIDGETACLRYGVDYATVTDSVVYGSTGATAEELAVLSFGSEEEAQDALKAVQLWLEDRREEMADYLPGESAKLDGAVAQTRGASLVLAVAADYDPVNTFLEG